MQGGEECLEIYLKLLLSGECNFKLVLYFRVKGGKDV